VFQAREGVEGWLKEKPPPAILPFKQEVEEVVRRETSPLCLAFQAREGWALYL
jgi:hypothetical protein